jgi:hypothetical protein
MKAVTVVTELRGSVNAIAVHQVANVNEKPVQA